VHTAGVFEHDDPKRAVHPALVSVRPVWVGARALQVRSGRDALKAHSSNKNEILLLFEATQYKAYYRLWEPLLKHFPAQRLAILSPDFITSASELWWLMLEQVTWLSAAVCVLQSCCPAKCNLSVRFTLRVKWKLRRGVGLLSTKVQSRDTRIFRSVSTLSLTPYWCCWHATASCKRSNSTYQATK
jgi:hypothetical protein